MAQRKIAVFHEYILSIHDRTVESPHGINKTAYIAVDREISIYC